MFLAVKTRQCTKNDLDNDVYYSHEIWRAGGFWCFYSVDLQVHRGTHILPTFLSHCCQHVSFGLQTCPLLVARRLRKLWSSYPHRTVSVTLSWSICFRMSLEHQGELFRSSFCRFPLRSQARIMSHTHNPKPITNKGNEITMVYLNHQDLTLGAGEKAHFPPFPSPPTKNMAVWFLNRVGMPVVRKTGQCLGVAGNGYNVGNWRGHHSRVTKQKHLQARSNSTKGTFSDDPWTWPCFTDELLLQEWVLLIFSIAAKDTLCCIFCWFILYHLDLKPNYA